MSGQNSVPSSPIFRQVGTSPSEIYYVAGIANEGTVSSAPALIANTMVLVPEYIGRTMIVDRVGIVCASATAGNLRLGIWSNVSTAALYPDALLWDSGSFACPGNVTASIQTPSTPVTLTPGLYWFGVVGSSVPVLRGVATGTVVMPILGFANTLSATPNLSITVAQTQANAFAATLAAGGAVGSAGGLPYMYYRLSA